MSPSPQAQFSSQIVARWNDETREIDRCGLARVTKRRNQTNDYSISMDDSYGERNPDNAFAVSDVNPGGRTITQSWQNFLGVNSYDASDNIVRKIYITGTLAGMPFSFPTCVPGNYTYSKDPKSVQYRFQLSGKGIADRMTRPQTSLPSLSAPLTAQQGLSSIFASMGLASDVSGVSPNYKIHRVNLSDAKGLKWLTDMLFAVQGAWKEVGEQIVCYIPYFPASGDTGYWSRTYYLDTGSGRKMSKTVSETETFNKVSVQRSTDLGAEIATIEGQSYGVQSFQAFTSRVPIGSIRMKPKLEQGGRIGDLWCYDNTDGHGLPVAVLYSQSVSPPVLGGGMAQGVVPHFKKNTSVVADFSLKGNFKAVLTAVDDLVPNADELDPVVLDWSAGQSVRLKEFEPNAYFDGYTMMNTFAQRYLARFSKEQHHYSLAVPFDPLLDVDFWIAIWNPDLNRWMYCEIDEVTHTLSSDPSVRQTEFVATEYVDASE